MAFSGTTYTLPVTTLTPDATAGTTIDSADFDTFTADLETALNVLSTKIPLNTDIIDIGTWNMYVTGGGTGSSTKSVAHGLAQSLVAKVRTISVMIRNDAASITYNLLNNDPTSTAQSTQVTIGATTISLVCSQIFDNTSFDTMGDDGNRGWITVQYID